MTLEPYDAFPNAPGLSDELGLVRADTLPPFFNEEGEAWYSICSRHQRGAEDCPLCRVGSYSKPSKRDLKLFRSWGRTP